MSKKYILIISLFLLNSCASNLRLPANDAQTLLPTEKLELVHYPQLNLKLRAGYSLETSDLKGCVLYLQGLADSIRNHKPYFSSLNDAGYRVIFFDYMGQGGSEGSMNDTRIQVELPPTATRQMIEKYEAYQKHYEIPEQGDFFWNRYKNVKNLRGQDCNKSPKLVIGWSTGGLSAYRMAHEKRADAVILLAPGIHPKTMVGESAKRWDKMVLFQQTITERTLTRNKFEDLDNPHIDMIKPKSPALVPQFAGNLLGVALHSTNWKIDSSIPGKVFLSGAEDTYVDRESTLQTISKNAAHFKIKFYDGALHELDNEIPEVADDVHQESILFFNSVVEK